MSKSRTVRFKPEQSARRGSVYMLPRTFDRVGSLAKRWGVNQKATFEVLLNLALDREGAP